MTEATPSVADTPLPASGYAALEDERLVRVTGPGTRDFLHGQFSQSLDEVTDSHSPRAAACTPKGRAYCLTRLVRDGEDVLLSLPTEIADDIQQQLGKYLMLFRGTSMSAEPDARMIGLFGLELARQLSPEADTALTSPGATVAVGRHRLIRSEDTAEGLARFEWWQLGPLSDQQSAALTGAVATTPANWRASEIAAGVARLSATSQAAYVPQMLNWQHLGGIHFKKGCYTGQEVVARMHYLGQLKKSLFRLRAGHCPEPAQPGTAILAGDRSVGEVVNAITNTEAVTEVLAVIRHDADTEALTLGEGGPALTPLPLPYTVTERSPDT
ncbi:MAG: folate-binding protein [Marinobacter sp.]|uniref:CAF17-like 4Fe-4S cluster assembly/insertion protein YgfZ n=1 Tax=Marinobacter sp. TaxID=50741 RepID=UPI00299F0041|nr:folate-binding protein [Marinobacter sp.]MDX1754468.1 folate-binding protein [Marinobacter sp.]